MGKHAASFTARLVAFAVVVPALSADVLVVDQALGPGADFDDVQDAIDAASDGDTILIREGAYASFVVDGVSLVILEEAGDTVSADHAVFRNLTASQEIVVRGLAFAGSSVPTGEWLLIEDNAGPLWFEECSTGSIFVTPTTNGAIVLDSADVTFLKCSIGGSSHLFPPPFGGLSPGGKGMRVVDSEVNVYDSVVAGGAGSTATTSTPAHPGGSGLEMNDAGLWMSGTEVRGGAGGSAYFDPVLGGCHGPPKAGGAGLLVVALPAVIRHVDTSIDGGPGGSNAFFCIFNDAPDGADLQGTPGFLLELPGDARSLSIPSPVREGDPVAFQISGAEGELAYVVLSLTHDPLWYPVFPGVVLSPLAELVVLFAGSVPSGGELTFQVPAPNVNAPFEAFTYYAQAILVTEGPAIAVGGGSEITVLDSAF